MQHIVAEKDEKHNDQLQAKDDQLKEKDAEHARQLQEKDDQLQEQSHTLAFVNRLFSSVPPGANKALVQAAARTEACTSEQPWDTTCDQKRSSEVERPRGNFGEDSSAGGGDSDSYGTDDSEPGSDPGAVARYAMLPASLQWHGRT